MTVIKPSTIQSSAELKPQDKEFQLLANQFLAAQKQSSLGFAQELAASSPTHPHGSPFAQLQGQPPAHQPPAGPNPWGFLQTASERYLNVFSLFAHQIASMEWIKNAPAHLPSYLNDKFFTASAPLAGTAASFLTHMFIRTFDYDPQEGKNPISFSENINRTVKSMAHSAVMFKTMGAVFSYSSAAISAVSGYFGVQSYFLYAPIFVGVGGASFIATGIGMLLLHTAISRVGVYQAFSDLMDYITGSTIKEPTKDELHVDSDTLKITQNMLSLFVILRQNNVDVMSYLKAPFNYAYSWLA